MTDIERFKFSLWDIAPDRWLDGNTDDEYRVVKSSVTGEENDEIVVVEVERETNND